MLYAQVLQINVTAFRVMDIPALFQGFFNLRQPTRPAHKIVDEINNLGKLLDLFVVLQIDPTSKPEKSILRALDIGHYDLL
jgi:hypothetical protein